MPWAVLDELAKLVHCDEVVYCEISGTRQRTQIEQSIDDEGERDLERREGDPPEPVVYWKHYPSFLPYSYPERTGDLVSVVRWSDFYTPTQLRSTPLIAEYLGPQGLKHSMGMLLSTASGHTRRINIFRDTGSDFSERDRLILQLLRPHLYEVYIDAQRRRLCMPRLSPREWEVLQLAHQGRSNADIARELFISIATVRKHFEHIFDRTGARTRTAAAALMIPHLPTNTTALSALQRSP
jgi:DNA-binding CsgD family transcriptional regulator